MQAFIIRKNIEHYRQLLQAEGLDESERQVLMQLLAEEQEKLTRHMQEKR
jgi:hypothetical protein